jgi:hypothetical protein
MFGNPVPDIFCNQCPPGTVAITDTGLFTFTAVDLGNAQASVDTFTIQGFRSGSLVFAQAGLLPTMSEFQTFTSTNPTKHFHGPVGDFNHE